MKRNNKITRSLCAAILSLCCLWPFSAKASSGEAPENAEVDVYAIDIEFGNLSFYYDYGVWNPNTMRYEAAASSTAPADGTAAGFPGWYGFDGIANRIAVKNSSTGGQSVTVSLTYRSLTEGELPEAGVTHTGQVTGVSMTVSGWDSTSRTVVPASKEDVIGYIHLHGEPQTSGGTYDSNIMAPIGMLVIKIEDWQ